MKNFVKGIFVTLLIEVIVFAYYTCNVQVNTTYTYNPEAIVAMMGNEVSTTTTK